jgi:ABC-2 type transport system ATP-binding protein
MSVLLARGVVQIGRGGDAVRILNGVNLDLEPGITVLLGPNGSGKTTLLRTLAGLLPPVEGHVEVAGVALQDSPERVRRLVGYLPQFPGLYHRLTVREHFERQAAWLRMPADPGLALARFGLSDLATRRAGTLAPRDRRRVALALLWARRCRVLLLDEPTAGLDPEDRLVFWDEVIGFRREGEGPEAVLVTTHLLSEADAFSDHAIVLAGGVAIFQGQTERLRAQASGATWTLAPGAVMRTGVVTGIDPVSSAQEVLLPVPGTPPPGSRPRPPRLRDGYLATMFRWQAAAERRGDEQS